MYFSLLTRERKTSIARFGNRTDAQKRIEIASLSLVWLSTEPWVHSKARSSQSRLASKLTESLGSYQRHSHIARLMGIMYPHRIYGYSMASIRLDLAIVLKVFEIILLLLLLSLMIGDISRKKTKKRNQFFCTKWISVMTMWDTTTTTTVMMTIDVGSYKLS